jgi:hypothetical protein
MTRRLRMAGMGLWAIWLPACSTTAGQTEDSRSGVAPASVTMARSSANNQPSLREQIAAGQLAAAPAVAPDPRSGMVANADGIKAPDLPPVANPLTDLPMPALPAPPDQGAATNIAAPAEAPMTIPANAQAAAAPSPPVVASFVNPPLISRQVAAPEEPIRRPAWPLLAPDAQDERPSQLPDKMPVATAPSDSAAPAPSAPIEAAAPSQPAAPAPMVVAPVETSTSLKVTEALAPEAKPAPSTTNESLLVRALRAFENNRPQEAVECLKHLDPSNQELLMYLMPLMVRLGENNAQALPPEELAMVIDRLQTASSLLKSKATLRAERVCFCRGVRKFADLDAYEPAHEFRPGDMVFLYAELKNFTCESAPAQPAGYNATRGCYVRLGATLELRDFRNNLVWRTDLNKNDYAQTPPQDYYHTYRFCVPDKLPAGTYTFWLTIVDKPTGRTIRKPIEMRIGQS